MGEATVRIPFHKDSSLPAIVEKALKNIKTNDPKFKIAENIIATYRDRLTALLTIKSGEVMFGEDTVQYQLDKQKRHDSEMDYYNCKLININLSDEELKKQYDIIDSECNIEFKDYKINRNDEDILKSYLRVYYAIFNLNASLEESEEIEIDVVLNSQNDGIFRSSSENELLRNILSYKDYLKKKYRIPEKNIHVPVDDNDETINIETDNPEELKKKLNQDDTYKLAADSIQIVNK